MCLFHLRSMLKRLSLSPIFPLADLMAEAFYWLSLWNFKKYNINRPLWRSLLKNPNRGKFPSSRRLLSAGAPRHQKNPSFLHGMGKRPHRSSQSPFRLFPTMPGDGRREKAAVLPNSPSTLTKVLGRRREGSSSLPRDVASPPSPKSTSGPRRNRRTRGGR